MNLNQNNNQRRIHITGDISVLASAICFYIATVFVKTGVGKSGTQVSYYFSGRFILGFLFISLFFLFKKSFPIPVRWKYIIFRAFFNVIAVVLFYYGVSKTSVGEANMLNMTYPVFIAIFSLFAGLQKKWLSTLITSTICFAGIALISLPANFQLNFNSFFALGSGITAALAILFLNIARQNDDAKTIMLYVFAIGTPFAIALIDFAKPGIQRVEIPDFILSCSFGIAGQFFLTWGFKHISALQGGILSSSRILIAALVGPLLFPAESYSVRIALGALFLFASNILVMRNRYS